MPAKKRKGSRRKGTKLSNLNSRGKLQLPLKQPDFIKRRLNRQGWRLSVWKRRNMQHLKQSVSIKKSSLLRRPVANVLQRKPHDGKLSASSSRDLSMRDRQPKRQLGSKLRRLSGKDRKMLVLLPKLLTNRNNFAFSRRKLRGLSTRGKLPLQLKPLGRKLRG